MVRNIAHKFLEFSNSSPTPFHLVSTSIKMLINAGFKRISFRHAKNPSFKPNGRYFFTRNDSALIAFVLGKEYDPKNGAVIVAAHTDSPGLHLKPVSHETSKGCHLMGVETYGGGLFDTWFDRDLGVAGRIFIRDREVIVPRYFKIDRPVVCIPSLAIHLRTAAERTKGLHTNAETHLRPIADLVDTEVSTREVLSDFELKHGSKLMKEILQSLDLKEGTDVLGSKLFLYDTQKASVGGLDRNLIHAARLDNQMMSFVALESLLNSLLVDEKDPSTQSERGIKMVALFDNEEVGSCTNRGARSRFLLSSIKSIVGRDALDQCLENSLLVSADMAHAIHPNYTARHSKNHENRLGGGLVIKTDADEHYATTDLSALFLTETAKRYNLPVQQFCPRQDSRTGSTVGPFLSANCGIRTVDVGIAQLAMHSIREMCCADDVESSVQLITKVFEEFWGPNLRIVEDGDDCKDV